MPKINILDRETAELIAAGEVVDRPSSVVKELVENAIDAGASAITVEIGNGGVRLIRVTDNGCGMEEEDVPKAFLRHATSKVREASDLDRIGTLGFRGEALPSIAAVSRVEVLTRTKEKPIGTLYELSGETAGLLSEAGGPVGTTVTVRDLFYNVPARMKFLKKDSTEAAAVATLLDRLALSHPEISFKLIRDRETRLSTPGSGDLLATVYAVYGNDFGRGLIPVECTVGHYTVKGFLSRPECCRSTRSMEHFFINHRYVKSMTMLAAVEESYRNFLMVGKFPGCVLNLTLDPAEVDVNVHPAKLEVKLSDERGVFDAVYTACRGALERMNQAVAVQDVMPKRHSPFEISQKPEAVQTRMSAEEYRKLASRPEALKNRYMERMEPPKKLSAPTKESGAYRLQSGAEERYSQGLPPKGTSYGTSGKNEKREDAPAPAPVLEREERSAPVIPPVMVSEREAPTPLQEEPALIKEEIPQARIIGELFRTFLLAEEGDRFLLIDKHAAHERINFNKLLKQHREGMVERQLLFSPIMLTVSKELYDTALSHGEILASAGFSVESFGEGCLSIREIPAILQNESTEDLVLTLLEKLRAGNLGSAEDLFDDLYHSVACKASIKGNIASSREEQEELLRQLMADPTVRNCPHGRPVMLELTRYEVEKMFGRIV